MLDHHRPASETPLEWRFDVGPVLDRVLYVYDNIQPECFDITVATQIRLRGLSILLFITEWLHLSSLLQMNYDYLNDIWVATLDFQQCGMCDQQILRSACAYAQVGQSLF